MLLLQMADKGIVNAVRKNHRILAGFLKKDNVLTLRLLISHVENLILVVLLLCPLLAVL